MRVEGKGCDLTLTYGKDDGRDLCQVVGVGVAGVVGPIPYVCLDEPRVPE